MAFGAAGDPALTRYEGEVTAREARALGVQWVFYPVADVNSNPDNPIINIRSFGENPEAVSAHVRAFIEGAHGKDKDRVLTTAKHFPGHGDTAVDTHLNLASIPADRAHLDAVELAPFRAAIAAGVDSIMTAHIAVPALAPADVPATLSPAILTKLLREELGFNGLVVTDALEMGGIAKGYKPGEAAVRALEAGADALLMTPDPEGALKAVLAAVRSRRLSEKRIEESVERLLAAKARVGLDRRRYVDPEAIGEEVNSEEANEKAQEIAERAVTLVKNEGGLIPLRDPARACFLVLAEGRFATGGQAFLQEVRKRAPGAATAPPRSHHARRRARGSRGQDGRLRRARGGRLRLGSRVPRHGCAGRRLPQADRKPDRHRQARGAGGARQSVHGPRLPERRRLSGDLQHRALLGDCRGARAVGRDPHRRATSRKHSRRGGLRGRNYRTCPNRGGPCGALLLCAIIWCCDRSDPVCLDRPAPLLAQPSLAFV